MPGGIDWHRANAVENSWNRNVRSVRMHPAPAIHTAGWNFDRHTLQARRNAMSIKLKHGLWVIVADGEKALFLRNQGDSRFPNLEVVQEMAQENPPTREQGSDRPGRYNDGPTVHRSAVQDTDWHRLNKDRFANEIAGRLYRLAHKGEFDDVVLIAPPRVLGEMRQKLHQEVGDKVRAEIPKTLTNHTIAEIETLLQSV